ncbi:MAG TPA: OsmC family protein [Polyangiaceae bacterium]
MTGVALRELYDRKARTLRRRPALGATSAGVTARLLDELACEVRCGTTTLVSALDVTERGGGNAAPTPGDLMRAALGACLAMGYRIWAARLDVDFDTVEVDVTCDFDQRGQLGLADDIPAGWQRISLEVRIVTDAPIGEVRRVVEQADRLNPMLANLSSAIARIHTLTVHPKTQPFVRL